MRVIEETGRTAGTAVAGPLSIYSVAEQKVALLDALRASECLVLDLSAVDDIDTAGFQLLLLLKRESLRLGKVFRLVGHSPAVRELIELYNMASYFGDPLVIMAQEQG